MSLLLAMSARGQASEVTMLDFEQGKRGDINDWYVNQGVRFEGRLAWGGDLMTPNSTTRIGGFPSGASPFVTRFVCPDKPNIGIRATEVKLEIFVSGPTKITWFDEQTTIMGSVVLKGTGERQEFIIPTPVGGFEILPGADTDCLFCTTALDSLSYRLVPAARSTKSERSRTDRSASVGKPPIGARTSVSGIVSEHKGELPFSIREVLGNQDHFWATTAVNVKEGHRYIALNSLGKTDVCPANLMDAIKNNLTNVFPFFEAIGEDSQDVTVGNKFNLLLPLSREGVLKNPVVVTNSTPLFFTFTAVEGHRLQGAATHGVFVDRSGEMWLFQEGQGVANKESADQIQNSYFVADPMWKRMAWTIRSKLIPMLKPNVCGCTPE